MSGHVYLYIYTLRLLVCVCVVAYVHAEPTCGCAYINPSKWQENDLVSRSHGQAGSLRGQ